MAIEVRIAHLAGEDKLLIHFETKVTMTEPPTTGWVRDKNPIGLILGQELNTVIRHDQRIVLEEVTQK